MAKATPPRKAANEQRAASASSAVEITTFPNAVRYLLERGQTGVFIDARSGALLGTRIPTGEYSGDTVSRWLQSLHMAKVFGLPYRIFVAIVGIALAVSAYTGLYVWWKKRLKRRVRAARVRSAT